MWRRSAQSLIVTALTLCVGAQAATRTCDGSMPVTSFRLSASPPDNQPNWVPLWHVNNLRAGYRIRYQPDDLPADMKTNAKLTLVMVPASSNGQITVLEPRSAATATEWQVPFTTRIMLLVFAPQGLDEKRLTNLVTKDDVMVTALADYADQTADLESSLDLIADLQDSASDAQRRATTPADQALFALVRALNPAVSGYDPLGAGRRAGPATLMGKGAAAFFDNAGGLVPGGGGGVLPEVKTWLMPDTDFRSVYQVPAPNGGMSLCAKLQPRTRNKIAYLWAYRVINSPPGAVPAALPVAHLPIGLRASVPLKIDKAEDWRLLSRVFDWTLTAEGSDPGNRAAPLPVPVRPIEEERALQLDLRQFSGPPGTYRLEGRYDWSSPKLTGLVWLHRLEDLSAVHLTPESQDRLIASSGPVNIDLTGANLLFLDHAYLHRPSSTRRIAADLPEVRTTPVDPLPVEIETDGLRPGPYLLALSRIDGATADIPVRLLPPTPRIDTANVRVHLGDREQAVTLAGVGLDRIQNLETGGADIVLQPASEDSSKRSLTVSLRADAKAGDRLALLARVEGMTQAIRFPGVLQVAAARPAIAEAKVSLPPEFTTASRGGLRDGELPAGSWANVSLRAAQPVIDAAAASAPVTPSAITLQCSDPQRTVQPITVRTGEKLASAQLSSPAPGVLFLSLDPGAVGQSGCALTATVESEALGKSDPFPLGTVVRLPHIESFTLTDEKAPEGFYGTLKGFDLETIDKTGWDNRAGVTVAGAPQPLAGEGARQILRITMPWPSPSPKAPLFIWLRGEADGRPTGVSP